MSEDDRHKEPTLKDLWRLGLVIRDEGRKRAEQLREIRALLPRKAATLHGTFSEIPRKEDP